MSRHTFKTTHDNRPVEVAAGWDRPLQGFYMTVLYTDDTEDYEYAFNNLDMRVSHPSTFNRFVYVLKDMGIVLPPQMEASIVKDGQFNAGNKIVDWTPTEDDIDTPVDERCDTDGEPVMSNDTQQQTLLALRDRIQAFDKACEAEEYTDTGDAWDLFNHIESVLTDLIMVKLTPDPKPQAVMVTVTVTACEGAVLHELDENVAGTYDYCIDGDDASEIALDRFHGSVPIKVLDDFDIDTEILS